MAAAQCAGLLTIPDGLECRTGRGAPLQSAPRRFVRPKAPTGPPRLFLPGINPRPPPNINMRTVPQGLCWTLQTMHRTMCDGASGAVFMTMACERSWSDSGG